MKPLWDAIVVAYENAVELNAFGYKLYQGFAGDRVAAGAPYAVLEIDNTEVVDTFDADVEMHDVRIVLYSRDKKPERVEEWLEACESSLSDIDLVGPGLAHGELRGVGHTAPTLDPESKTYSAEIRFRAYGERSQPVPVRV